MNKKLFSDIEAHEYWIERHKQFGENWQSTGMLEASQKFNSALYECRTHELQKAIDALDISMTQAKVLDVGSGMGTFSQYYASLGANVSGIDISPDSVQMCNKLNIGHFVQSPIYNLDKHFTEKFDIIHCFDVLYHMTDDNEWYRALESFANLSSEQTIWFISEIYTDESYVSSPHLKKRSIYDYQKLFERYNRQIVRSVPLYWFVSIFPRLSRKLPKLITLTQNWGSIVAPLAKEYAVFWIVKSKNTDT